MKTYLEIQVPFRYDAPWFKNLRTAFTDISVKWQEGFYHVTMAFLDETPSNVDLRPILEKHLGQACAPTITFDKLNVFATRSGMYIINLTSSSVPKEFLHLTESIRNDLKNIGCQMQSGFLFHVTLGRISERGVSISDLKLLLESVELSPFSLALTDVDYRVFRGRTIYETKLNNNKIL